MAEGPSLNDILSQYALKETDLSIKCPREVRNEIAVKFIDWKMIGYSLGFPAEKLTSIGRENETQDLCKVALLDSWSKREGEGASYLKLADALYRRQRRDLVEFLCKLLIASRGATAEMGKCRQTTSSSTVEGAVAVRSRARTPGLEETFMCPCGGCSLMVYLKNGCPKSCIPYLGMPVNLSVGDKRNLKYALNKDTRKLCESFRDLSDSTCESLITRDIKLDRLIRVAKNHDKSLQLSSVKSVDEAFTILAESMSFFNHKLLANIIEKLGDESDKQRLVKYSEEFNLYCKRKIFEVDPGTWAGSERFPEAPKGRQLFAVVVSDFMVETLGDTELVLETLADILDIQPAALHIHRIDKGSVILVFSVPSCIADEIFPLPQEKISLLKAKGIMIFLPSISNPQNLKSNRAPPILPSYYGARDFGTGLSHFCDSGFYSHTNMEMVSPFPGSSHGSGLMVDKDKDKDAQLTQGANVLTTKSDHDQSPFIPRPSRPQILERFMKEKLDLKKTISDETEKDPTSAVLVPKSIISRSPPSSYPPPFHQSGFSRPSAACVPIISPSPPSSYPPPFHQSSFFHPSAASTENVPIPLISRSPPSSYSPLPHQSDFSHPSAASSVPKSVIQRPAPSSYYLLASQRAEFGFSSSITKSMAEQNDLHDMSMEELKRECQHLRDQNRQLQLKVHGVNELARLLQDRSELVRVLEEKNKRLEIAVVRLENRCADYDRVLKSQKEGNIPMAKSDHIPGPSRQILEGLMKENSYLKKVIDNLTGKGAAGYPVEAVKPTQLGEVIDQQEQEIDVLKDQQTSTGEKGAGSLEQLSSPPVDIDQKAVDP